MENLVPHYVHDFALNVAANSIGASAACMAPSRSTDGSHIDFRRWIAGGYIESIGAFIACAAEGCRIREHLTSKGYSNDRIRRIR